MLIAIALGDEGSVRQGRALGIALVVAAQTELSATQLPPAIVDVLARDRDRQTL